MIKMKKLGAAALVAAAFFVFAPQLCHAQAIEEQMDGVMGQSLREEAEDTMEDGGQFTAPLMNASTVTAAAKTSSVKTLTEASFTTGMFYSTEYSTYYHKKDYEDRLFLKGIDVSWWQSKGKANPATCVQSALDWKKVHQAGVDFAFVRVGSRDTTDHSIYEDTCANDHITKASAAGLKVGLYLFSQARTAKEAKEEANFILQKIKAYGWDITMPLVIDREPGRGLKSGRLSKTAETAVCQAFVDTVTAAGYRACVYASYSWIHDYIDTGKLKNCSFWIARYHKTTTSNGYSGNKNTYPAKNAYADVSYNYSFWQYSQYAKVPGAFLDKKDHYLDANFGYLDVSPSVTGLRAGTVTDREVTLNWDFGNHMMPYRVYRYNEERKLWERVTATYTYQNTYTDTGLQPGTTYRYKVRTYWKLNGKEYFGSSTKEYQVTTKREQVAGLKVDSRADTSLQLSWNTLPWADGYRVYLYDPVAKKSNRIAEVTADITSYLAQGLTPGTTYQYKVRAFRREGTEYVFGTYSDWLTTKTLPAKVEGVKASGELASMVQVSWKPVTGADGYGIYERNPADGSLTFLAAVRNGATIYKHTGRSPLTTYQYQVCAFVSVDGKDAYGAVSEPVTALTGPGKITGLRLSVKSSTVTLRWDKAAGVSGYRVYRLNSKTKKYERLTTLSGENTLSWKDEKRATATAYSYKVRAYVTKDGRTGYGDYSDVKTAAIPPAKVTGLSLSATASAVTVKWNKVSRASGYQVYRWNSKEKKYQYVKYVKGGSITSYVNTGRAAGTEYRYKVRAYFATGGKNYYGSYSDVKTVITKPAKVKGLKASSKSSTVTLTWSKASGASGYQIYRRTLSGKYTKVATVKSGKTVSYKNTKLKKGTTYLYKVRAYQTKNGKTYYGDYTSAVKMKVK